MIGTFFHGFHFIIIYFGWNWIVKKIIFCSISILNKNELSDLWFETVSVNKVVNESLSHEIIKFANFHVWHLVTAGTIQDCLKYNCLAVCFGLFESYQNVLHFKKKGDTNKFWLFIIWAGCFGVFGLDCFIKFYNTFWYESRGKSDV